MRADSCRDRRFRPRSTRDARCGSDCGSWTGAAFDTPIGAYHILLRWES